MPPETPRRCATDEFDYMRSGVSRQVRRQVQINVNGCPVPQTGTGRYKVKDNGQDQEQSQRRPPKGGRYKDNILRRVWFWVRCEAILVGHGELSVIASCVFGHEDD